MMEGFWVDWDALEVWTEVRRVYTLRKILSDPKLHDSFKLWLVSQKSQGFENENKLLKRLRDAGTKDLSPPGTPEDDERKIQVKALFLESLKMHKALYHEITMDIMCLPDATASATRP